MLRRTLALTLAVPTVALTTAGLVPASAATVPTCHGVAATIVGTPGDDTLVGTDGADVIVGLGGNDHLGGCAATTCCAADSARTGSWAGVVTTPSTVASTSTGTSATARSW
ncbi:hypothetical protein [Nocardioides ungokensis]|uniref:hypothetical protein n=1 Tax=Nocardioides ungokensis TaxID=1643322 RepID=UPI002483927F|nr:hypothetical protein [Nocardioides ungokensis]